MSESDNEVGHTDRNALPDPAGSVDRDTAARRRAFRGWSPAQSGSDQPSVVSRVRHSLSMLFTPKPDVGDGDGGGQETIASPGRSAAPVAGDTDDIYVAPELAETLDPDVQRPGLIGRFFGGAPVASLPDLAQPGASPAGASAPGELPGEKTDEFEVPPPAEPATEPLSNRLVTWLSGLLARFRRKAQPDAAPAAQTVVGGNPVFLYSKFRAFYNEIIRFRHQRTEFAAGFATALMTEDATFDEDPEAAAASLGRKLFELLELQAAEAKWMGGEMALRYPDAQFAMAALADEMFTHVDWDGRVVWQSQLLEHRLFRTQGGAHEVFRRIDRLLKESPNTPVSRDLARVYLQVLAAGFQGKYRPFGLTRALAEYRQRLYEYIYRDDALMLYAPERRLIPDIPSRTLEGNSVSRVTAAQRWAAILAFLAIGYTVVAHVAWNRVSADLADVTSRIVTDSADGER